MTGQGIHILRWSNEYIVSREHVAAEEARIGLDTVARDLCSELTEGLEPWMSSQDDRVLLLNRLDFDCELDLTRERWTLARRWASAFARALIRASDVEVSGVARFSSQAEYRAQFLSDLVAGHAWHLWYYQPFDGIRHLPVASALRTLLLEDPALGRATLAAMTPAAWSQLAACLTAVEAARILEGVSDDGDADTTAFEAVLQALARHAPATEPWFVLALRLFVAAIRDGAAATATLATFVRLVAKAATLAAHHPVATVTRAIAHHDLRALALLAGGHDLHVWSPLAQHPMWRSLVCDAIERVAPRQREAEQSAGDEAFTRFGGFLLLLPEIDALLSDAVSHALPASTIGNARNLAAWMALAHSVGGAASSAFVREAFWRDFLGIPPTVTLDALTDWLEEPLARNALTRLAGEARERSRGADVLTTLTAGGVRRRVVADLATLLWIRFDENGPMDPAPWRARRAAARVARADWTYLAPPWQLPPDWDLFFAQIAQVALRRFAYRIPGFAASSLAHLHANFLGVPGRWDSRRRQMRLSRPPLHTMLQFTGIARGPIRWSGPPAVDLGLEFEP
jgi:hypothetical protein